MDDNMRMGIACVWLFSVIMGMSGYLWINWYRYGYIVKTILFYGSLFFGSIATIWAIKVIF
uniref:hypothetical protein n=1 Tax=Aquabacterium sp. TaxID=1872578 RepID=UPI0025C0431E